MFSLESSDRGDSNEYTQYTIFNINTKIIPNPKAMRFFSKGLKNEFERAVVNESVFEPLKFYCRSRHRLFDKLSTKSLRSTSNFVITMYLGLCPVRYLAQLNHSFQTTHEATANLLV